MIEELYEKFNALPTNAEMRKFILELPKDKRYKFLVYLMDKKSLLLSDIMNSLGIWRIE